MPKWKRVEEHLVNWLTENRQRFAVEPSVTKTEKRSVHFGFTGIRPEINAVCYQSSRYGCISIAADYQGECWDLLEKFTFFPDVFHLATITANYAMCRTESISGPDERALVNHLFEPLLSGPTNI